MFITSNSSKYCYKSMYMPLFSHSNLKEVSFYQSQCTGRGLTPPPPPALHSFLLLGYIEGDGVLCTRAQEAREREDVDAFRIVTLNWLSEDGYSSDPRGYPGERHSLASPPPPHSPPFAPRIEELCPCSLNKTTGRFSLSLACAAAASLFPRRLSSNPISSYYFLHRRCPLAILYPRARSPSSGFQHSLPPLLLYYTFPLFIPYRYNMYLLTRLLSNLLYFIIILSLSLSFSASFM